MRLEPYWAVILTCFKEQLAYRFDLMNGIIGPFLTIAVLWFVWTAVYASSAVPVIGGFTFTAMMTYTAMAVVMRTYTWLGTEYEVEQDVKSGSVVSILIKPLSYPLYNFARDTGATAWWMITKLPLIIFAFYFLGISGPVSLLFFVSAFLGYIVNYFMVFITAMWAFWTAGSIWGLRLSRQVIGEVLSGALMPLTLFPFWMQGVFNLLPFQAVFYAPLSIYLGIVTGNAVFVVLAVQLAWVGMLFAVTWFLWQQTIKRVVVQGG